jgi:hypothetical protein
LILPSSIDFIHAALPCIGDDLVMRLLSREVRARD